MQFLYDVQRLIACGDLLRVRRYVWGWGGSGHTHTPLENSKFFFFFFKFKITDNMSQNLLTQISIIPPPPTSIADDACKVIKHTCVKLCDKLALQCMHAFFR